MKKVYLLYDEINFILLHALWQNVRNENAEEIAQYRYRIHQEKICNKKKR